MNSILLITLSGVDRVGIVREVAHWVTAFGANWERSRMIRLSGRFVGLLQVSVTDEKKGGPRGSPAGDSRSRIYDRDRDYRGLIAWGARVA